MYITLEVPFASFRKHVGCQKSESDTSFVRLVILLFYNIQHYFFQMNLPATIFQLVCGDFYETSAILFYWAEATQKFQISMRLR